MNTPPEIPKEIELILKDPQIFKKITEDEFDKKIVGEIESRKVIFLCAVGGSLVENCQIASYNLLVNDEAGAGKDYITASILEILPTEKYIRKTRISPTVFTYWHNSKYEPLWTWDGKTFYAEDISEAVLNSDVFKVMMSSGSSATIVIKQQAIEIEIKGKPVIIATTASAVPNAEAVRRLGILNLDSSEDQTKAILKRHSQFKKKGIKPEYDKKYCEALKWLQRIKVKIPFADLMDQYFPIKNIIMRTHYPRFLDYVCASTAIYQYQRSKDGEGFFLAEGQDYDIARECFMKICSNKYMIPLTINQKKILRIFEENNGLNEPAAKLHSTKCNFLSLPALQTNLGLLTKYGILQTRNENDTWNRDITTYSLAEGYNPNEQFDLPTFHELMQNQLNTLNSSTILNTLKTLTPPIKNEQKKKLGNEGGTKGIEGIKPKTAIEEGVLVKLVPLSSPEFWKCIDCSSTPVQFKSSEGKFYCRTCSTDFSNFVIEEEII